MWRSIETPPDPNVPVIVAAKGAVSGQWHIGEAMLHVIEGQASWWWANTGPGDYHADSLESGGTPPLWWQPMPDGPPE